MPLPLEERMISRKGVKNYKINDKRKIKAHSKVCRKEP